MDRSLKRGIVNEDWCDNLAITRHGGINLRDYKIA
jgi:hypothetical protein